MKRTFVTVGVVGLGLLSVTAPAMAAPERVIVCHSDGSSWTPLEFNINGLNGHDQHPLDIIPPTSESPGKNWTNAGKLLYVEKCAALPPGETLPEEPAEEEPVVETPVVETPVVETPVVETPVVETPVVETPVVETPVVETPVVETPVVQTPAGEAPALTPAAEQSVLVPPAAAPGAAPQAAAPVASAPRAAVQQPTAVTGATSLGTNQGYNAQTAVGGSGSTPSWLAGLGALAAAGAAVALRRRSRPFTPAG
ncbi:hypothetical protein J2X12_002641 [Pseudarthrobacter oxydans]|uniref:LPXTG cell wall anchor domain-containing protein n=1 Tax=Pseudarthrobacter oxydans TaxID=1671 RepID=A0AAW8NEW7_PSEOX|nr:hypothetical protein [Pseudarthrobacter oxydans]MDR6793581.1 hypothetical protein [Pseudarthrobacter oxydans]MDR7164603.1 hypothetical protein [Pseudarthrobacter oxydans]